MNTLPEKPIALPIIILAGGQSRRLKSVNYERKWQLPFGDSTLLQHMLNIASDVSNTVLINSSNTNSKLFTQYQQPIISDDASQGPLSGILCALNWGAQSGYKAIMTLPCDTPFLSAQWLNYLYDQFRLSKRSAVISRYNDEVHPLCGIWSTQLSADLATLMQNSEKKAVYHWAHQYAQFVDYEQHNTDSHHAIDPFMNINTPEDYENALKLRATL